MIPAKTDFNVLLNYINTSDDVGIKTFLEKRPDYNLEYQDEDKRTILFYAVLRQRPLAVAELLTRGANPSHPDRQQWTPLHYAAQEYLVTIGELLLRNGASVDARDENGNTPLWRAVFASKGKGDFIKLLLQSGANPDSKNNKGISPRDLAAKIANYDIKQFIS
jgi:ankyrin repeat protein